jgi:hypothetical protein
MAESSMAVLGSLAHLTIFVQVIGESAELLEGVAVGRRESG